MMMNSSCVFKGDSRPEWVIEWNSLTWGKLEETAFFWLIAAYHKSQIATKYTTAGEYRMIVDAIHPPSKKHR
jgi:hypothetical protein